MRMISPGPKAPLDVNRYLLPHEQEVITIRRHPAVLIPWAAAPVGGLLVTLAMTSIVHGGSVQLIAWILTAFLWAELIVAALHWWVTYIVVTSHRLLICSGLAGRGTTERPLVSLPGMGVRRSLSGRLFGYGSFILPDRTRIDYVPYPDQIYLETIALLYPDRHHDGD